MTTDEETISPLDIPQADSLPMIRLAMSHVSKGKSTASGVADELQVSRRHAHYCLNAGRILGWLAFDDGQLELLSTGTGTPSTSAFKLTPEGISFLTTQPASASERSAIAHALGASQVLRRIVPDLLSGNPDIGVVAARLQEVGELSAATARRRAQTILAWRRAVVAPDATADEGSTEGALEPTVTTLPAVPDGHDREAITGTTDRLPSNSSEPQLPTTPVPPRGPPPQAPLPAVGEMGATELAYLRTQLEQARLALVVAPGFGQGLKSRFGTPLLGEGDLLPQLWAICYPGEPRDETVRFQDLLAFATQRSARETFDLMQRATTVADGATIPSWYSEWMSVPWAKIYSLAVDDSLEVLSAKLGNVRAPQETGPVAPTKVRQAVQVLRLRGTVRKGNAFQSDAESDANLRQLEIDLLAYPFVLCGSTSDQDLLWTILERRGRRAPHGTREYRPKSYLVVPDLSRPRRALLAEHNFVWVRATPEEFVDKVLALPDARNSVGLGNSFLAKRSLAATDTVQTLPDVSGLLAAEKQRRTEYLLGEEPTWSDLQTARAIERDIDAEMRDKARLLLRGHAKGAPTPVFAIGGTAGSGKSTSLMRLAIVLAADGNRVTWVGRDVEASPKTLRNYAKNEPAPILAIDDVDRYGAQTASLIDDLSQQGTLGVILIASRSVKLEAITKERAAGQPYAHFRMPALSDSDIGRLIDVLARDHRLGRLRGQTRELQEAAFRQEAGRILIVAMIQATLGRKFDERIVDEWTELSARSRAFYTLVVIASRHRFTATREQLLAATETSRTPEDPAALEALKTSHIVSVAEAGGLRARHQLIAEKLFDHLKTRESEFSLAVRNLAFAVTTGYGPEVAEGQLKRFVIRIINNRNLFSFLSLENCRLTYDAIEPNLHWDYHYWLQRGALEVAEGDLGYAEQFLSQAKGLNPEDNLVLTEWAYLLMKKATSYPYASQAEACIEEGVTILRGQIAARGKFDWKPYHVLGSQAISWCKSKQWVRDARVEFLKKMHRIVKDGLDRFHPKQEELQRLEKDILRRTLEIEALEDE